MRKISIQVTISPDHGALAVLESSKPSVRRAVLGRMFEALLEHVAEETDDAQGLAAQALDDLIGERDVLEFCLANKNPEVVLQAKALHCLATRNGLDRIGGARRIPDVDREEGRLA